MKIHVFTHYDLDGVTSLLVAKWFYNQAKITYTPIYRAGEFRAEFTSWLSSNSLGDYDKVLILDLFCHDAYDLIDSANVIIFDHHNTHVEAIKKQPYKRAKCVVKETTSCSMLLYKVMRRAFPDIDITKPQKLLVVIADDYDSYTLAIKYSEPLNWVYSSYNQKFETFLKRWHAGFTGFNTNEISMIKIKIDTVKKIIRESDYFRGTIKGYSVIAAIANDCPNELHQHMLDNYGTDVTIVVMTKQNRVSWRKQRDCDAPLARWAEKLCDGGGHDYAAGGKITESFQKIAMTFEHV